jgi:hypothetical protein
MIVVLFAFVIIFAPISSVSADVLTIVLGNDETNLIPVDCYSVTRSSDYEAPSDLCVANDGTVFMVAFHPYWRFIRGPTSTSLISWSNDGSVRWTERLNSFDRVLYDVETDDTHVFAVGGKATQLFLAKYDLDGNQVWNVTKSMGGISYGMEFGCQLFLLDDGTLIVGGITMDYSDDSGNSDTYFLAAFGQEGNSQWNQTFQDYLSYWCETDYIYLIAENSLQKRNRDGAVLWTRYWNDCRLLYVKTDIWYTMEVRGSTSMNLSAWNSDTEQELWFRNFRLCDSIQQVYNSSGMDVEVDHDGSMMILQGISEVARWYLLHVDQDGKLASKLNHLNVTVSDARLKLDDTGRAYVAGVSTTGNLTVSVFDTGDFVPISTSTTSTTTTTTAATATSNGEPFGFQLSDTQLVGLVLVGVVILGIAVILLLKKH